MTIAVFYKASGIKGRMLTVIRRILIKSTNFIISENILEEIKLCEVEVMFEMAVLNCI